MQEPLKRLTAELHDAYFKPNGFKKERARFRRTVDIAVQEIFFHSSRWNSSDSPVSFSIYVYLGFTDIPGKDGRQSFASMGHIAGLVPSRPPLFPLTSFNYESTKKQILEWLPQAVAEWPKHYEDVRRLLKSADGSNVLYCDYK
jgi:hypothetical protein